MCINNIIIIDKIIIDNTEVNSINARELHRELNLKSDFSTWIKKELELFTEDVDYLTLHKKVERQILMEYIITLDTAKHLSMIQRNAKGKEIRDYFIEAEKQLNKPLTITEQISLIAKGHYQVEERIIKLEKTKRLENWQERSLQTAKNKKVYELAKDNKDLAGKLHRKVWNLFKKEFNLPRYNELPAIKYEDGIFYINNLIFADMVT